MSCKLKSLVTVILRYSEESGFTDYMAARFFGVPQNDTLSTEHSSLIRHSKHPRGFTLVELMIVVIIIGILAAIVIPQFSNASQLARENTLRDELRYLRTQIVVYKAQHRDLSPGYQNGSLAGGVDVVMVQQLTQYTDETGNCSATTSNVFKYGPYLLKMPSNPLTGNTVIEVQAGAGTLVPDNTTGWAYNPVTGDIIANSTLSDAGGTAYATY